MERTGRIYTEKAQTTWPGNKILDLQAISMCKKRNVKCLLFWLSAHVLFFVSPHIVPLNVPSGVAFIPF